MDVNILIAYIGANGAVMVLVLIQLFKIERRLGSGASILDQLKKICPMLNGKQIKMGVQADGKESKMG